MALTDQSPGIEEDTVVATLLGYERHGLVRTLEGHTDSVKAIAFSPDGKYIITGSFDRTARIWETSTGKLVRTIRGQGGFWSASFSPDGRYILTNDMDEVNLWEPGAGKLLHTFDPEHPVLLYSASFSPDSQFVVSSGQDELGGVTLVWSIVTGKRVHTFRDDSTLVRTAIFSPDGKDIAYGNDNGIVTIWEVATGKVVRSFKGIPDGGPITSVAYSPNGKYILVGGDPVVYLWDAKTGEQVRTLSGHTKTVMSVAFSPDGKYIVTASFDKTAKLWETSTGRLMHTIAGHTGKLDTAVFSPDGKYIVTGSYDKTAKVWKVGDITTGPG